MEPKLENGRNEVPSSDFDVYAMVNDIYVLPMTHLAAFLAEEYRVELIATTSTEWSILLDSEPGKRFGLAAVVAASVLGENDRSHKQREQARKAFRALLAGSTRNSRIGDIRERLRGLGAWRRPSLRKRQQTCQPVARSTAIWALGRLDGEPQASQ